MKRNLVILFSLPFLAFGLGIGTWLFVGDVNSLITRHAAAATCGDWVIEYAPETCDDGNTNDGDGCDSSCAEESPATCGNGVIERAEYCDDGNTDNGDGCNSLCQIECTGDEDCDFYMCWRDFATGDYYEYSTDACFGGTCIMQPEMPIPSCLKEDGPTVCRDGIDNDGDTDVDCDDSDCSSDPTCSAGPVCSNGIVEPPETCDDDDDNNNDMCPDGVGGTCIIATCGDGFLCSDGECTTGPGGGPEECENDGHCTVPGETCNVATCDCTVGTPSSSTCNNDGTDDGAPDETCSNCPNDAYDCESDEKCINGTCTDTDGTCAREDVCGDGWVGLNEACDDGGICKGSSNAAFENQNCGDLDTTLIAGVARCRATGGWCQAQDGDGCDWDCQDECVASAGPCLVDADCCGGSCTDGVCGTESCEGDGDVCCDVGDGCAGSGGDGECSGSDVCCDSSGCSTCTANETPGAECKDGLDNDCDGLWDCLDTDCHGDASSCDNCPVAWPFLYPAESDCFDVVDNDCDGHADCDDRDDCFTECGLSCPSVPEICDNNMDDDCDGMADCSDSPECDGQACYPPGGTCVGGACQ